MINSYTQAKWQNIALEVPIYACVGMKIEPRNIFTILTGI